MTDYHHGLLLRLRHLVGLRRAAKLWANTSDTGRRPLKRSLRTALVDAERERRAAEVAAIITGGAAAPPPAVGRGTGGGWSSRPGASRRAGCARSPRR